MVLLLSSTDMMTSREGVTPVTYPGEVGQNLKRLRAASVDQARPPGQCGGLGAAARPSLAITLETCTLTVLAEMNSCWPISPLLRPAATSARISRSRGVSTPASAPRPPRASPAPRAAARRGGARPAPRDAGLAAWPRLGVTGRAQHQREPGAGAGLLERCDRARRTARPSSASGRPGRRGRPAAEQPLQAQLLGPQPGLPGPSLDRNGRSSSARTASTCSASATRRAAVARTSSRAAVEVRGASSARAARASAASRSRAPKLSPHSGPSTRQMSSYVATATAAPSRSDCSSIAAPPPTTAIRPSRCQRSRSAGNRASAETSPRPAATASPTASSMARGGGRRVLVAVVGDRERLVPLAAHVGHHRAQHPAGDALDGPGTADLAGQARGLAGSCPAPRRARRSRTRARRSA